MSALPKQRMTVGEYFALEKESGVRHEYYFGEVFAMVGASENHNIITGNLYMSLRGQMRGRDCLAYQTDVKVRINRYIYTYPDIAAVCGERRFEDEARTILLNPMVIIEVLSPSTEDYDRADKFQHYRTLDSLQEYVLVSQKAPHVEHFARQPDGKWLLSDVDGLKASFELTSIGCTLSLSDIYEQIVFEQAED
jgi:Uma2 family endonuclease